MRREFSKNEAGYSLVEVLVAIVILAVAIIPMVGMFDAGLRAATTGGRYDQARALANQNLEKVRALDYERAVAQYPAGTGNCPGFVGGTDGLDSCTYATTRVNSNLADDAASTSAIRIDVTVRWSGGSYKATGVKARGSS